MLKARMMRSIPLLAMLACGACVGGPPIVTASAASCSSLLPVDWKNGVAGADLPNGNTVGDWIAFGDAQTGKLDQANDRTRSSPDDPPEAHTSFRTPAASVPSVTASTSAS